MAKCSCCGKSFKISDARAIYNDEFEEEGITYDEEFPDHDMCGICAMNTTGTYMSVGEKVLYELETGKQWEDRDEDEF